MNEGITPLILPYITAPDAQSVRRSTTTAGKMAKVLATEIRAGNLIEWEKRVWRVLKSYHVHVGGRGGAFMQVEMKDIESGTKKNERIRTEDKIERAVVESRNMEYLYND